MAAPKTQELTFDLPQDVVEMLRQAAAERQETPDQLVAEALRFSLQPVRQEALQRLKGHIRRQQAQSESEIRAHLEARLHGEEEARLGACPVFILGSHPAAALPDGSWPSRCRLGFSWG